MGGNVHFHDQSPHATQAALRDELLAGLRANPKSVSPKLLYDRRGSALFDRICEQPEYYPTRTEEGILTESVTAIAEVVGHEATLIELGSGASRKIRLLLEALRPVRYLGVDISREFLRESTQWLADDYPWLEVHAIHADFCQRVALPPGVPCERPVAFFPGSSIGNFAPSEAQNFLRGLHGLLPAGGGLLVGVDLIKDARILDAAYNDAAGLTAAFNRNLLLRMRDEFEGDLDPQRFMHRAFYNAAESRVEMHLVSADEQRISVAGEQFHFSAGETLHTENSYKYSVAGFQALAAGAGFMASALWTDRAELFSLHYLERV